MNDPCGSKWRKWDLHVHTPYSTLNNNFGNDWDEYVKQLFSKALKKNVAVIAITDYFHIEGYKKLLTYLNDETKLLSIFEDDKETVRKIKEILVLPNIEFRLNKIMHHNNDTKRLTMHVIFAEADCLAPPDIEEHFLHDLEFTYEGNPQNRDEVHKLKIRNLEELGRKLKQEHATFNDKTDLFVGMMNAVVDDGKILEILSSQPKRFKNKFLVGLAEEYTSLMDWDRQDHLTRKVLLQKSDFVFSSSDKTRSFCLGEKHPSRKEFIKEFKSLKPCLWGSDAHDYQKLFEPDKKQYAWIKSDTTFEGLRQTIFEPTDRVCIGEDHPEKMDKSRIIESIILSNTGKWFENKEYKFNDGLISVIGGKGAGKTALLDLIAFAADGCVKEIFSNENSFLKKACMELSGASVEIVWGDGTKIKRDIVCCKDKSIGYCENVVYLSQSFVANLCSESGKGQLQAQVENVIFQNIPEEDKASFNSFSEYKNFRLQPIKLAKEKIRNRMSNINKSINDDFSLIKRKTQVESDLVSKKDLLSKREAELKRISDSIKGDEIKEKIENMSKARESQRKIESKITALKEKLSLLTKVRGDISDFHDYTSSFFKDLKDKCKALGISEDMLGANAISVNLNLDDALQAKEKELNETIKTEGDNLRKEKEKIVTDCRVGKGDKKLVP